MDTESACGQAIGARLDEMIKLSRAVVLGTGSGTTSKKSGLGTGSWARWDPGLGVIGGGAGWDEVERRDGIGWDWIGAPKRERKLAFQRRHLVCVIFFSLRPRVGEKVFGHSCSGAATTLFDTATDPLRATITERGRGGKGLLRCRTARLAARPWLLGL